MDRRFMFRCGDCQYLGNPITKTEWPNDPKYKGDCVQVETGYYKCLYIEHAEDNEYLINQQKLAYVQDGSGFYAALVVKDDFGCVNFKPKGDRDG